MNAKQLQQYLKSFGKISSMNDIKQLKSNSLFNNEFNNQELQDSWEHIKSHLKKNIQQGINKLIDVKDQKSQLSSSNCEKIFSIPTREEKSISVDTYDMDYIIKKMIPIIQQIDPQFIDKVKSQIQEKYRQNGIDNTFCFQQGSKERLNKLIQHNLQKSNKNKRYTRTTNS